MSRSTKLHALLLCLPLLAVGALASTASATVVRGVTRGDLHRICHHASAKHFREMFVDDAAFPGHMSHGDEIGPCPVPGGGVGGGGGPGLPT